MHVVSGRATMRALLFGGLVFLGVLLFAGKAHALDATSTSAASPSSTPSGAPPTATNTDSTLPPSAPQPVPAASPPAGAAGPGGNNQNASVGTNGTALSNSGGNLATTSGPAPKQTSATPTSTTPPTSTTTTGPATAKGSDSTSAISQQANAHTTAGGTVEILQIGLIINVGVGTANSGHNVAAAGTSHSPWVKLNSKDRTGNASATGNNATTGITQRAVVTNGDQSNQKVTVLNVGIGIANTGVNITIATGDGPGATTAAFGTSKIGTGGAWATGNHSSSGIAQVASGSASGTAQLTIDQRAYIVNFGVAIANTGGNFALSSLDASGLSPQEQQLIQLLLGALIPMFGTGGTSHATINTGRAHATGNASTTLISQSVVGTVSGNATANASQRAAVANFGLALANSGLNGALAGTTSSADLVAAQDAFSNFLSLLANAAWLQGDNPFAQFSNNVDLGNGLTLDLGGTISGADILAGWDAAYAPDGGPLAPGVHVRQISAVLNIGFAFSDSGHNVSIAVQEAAAATHKTAKKQPGVTVTASVTTGDATAIGNHAVVLVCQTFGDAKACLPKQTKHPAPHPTHDPSTKPTSIPAVAAAARVPAALPTAAAAAAAQADAPQGSLPFTGGDARDLAAIGGTLLAAGATLARRRRVTR